MIKTPVEVKRELLTRLNDEELFDLYSDYPTIGSLVGYSSEAILSHAECVAALRAELYLRGLVPS